jgi:hypothetical protein
MAKSFYENKFSENTERYCRSWFPLKMNLSAQQRRIARSQQESWHNRRCFDVWHSLFRIVT